MIMPSRKPANPLNRWATIEPYQHASCVDIARILANADSYPLTAITKAIACYSDLVWSTSTPTRTHNGEWSEIQLLSWKKALAAELRKHKHRAPDATAEQTLCLGTLLHHWPKRLKLPSLLCEVAEKFDHDIRFDHLTRICPMLCCYDIEDTAEEHIETYTTNQTLIIGAFDLTVANCWSPKKLEMEIATCLNRPTAGRPPKPK